MLVFGVGIVNSIMMHSICLLLGVLTRYVPIQLVLSMLLATRGFLTMTTTNELLGLLPRTEKPKYN